MPKQNKFLTNLKKDKIKSLVLLNVILFACVAVVAFILLRKPKTPEVMLETAALADTAVLSMQAPSSVVSGSTLTVGVYLNTGNALTDGVDVLVNFDPSLFTLTNVVPVTGCDGAANPVTCFKTFAPITDETTGAFNVDKVTSCANDGSYGGETCTQGQVEFGAVTFDFKGNTIPDDDDITSPFSSNTGVHIADLVFTAKTVGSDTPTTFSFVTNTSAPTTDTNVAAHNTTEVDDILDYSQLADVDVTVLADVQDPCLAPLTEICSGGDGGSINFAELSWLVGNWGQLTGPFTYLSCLTGNWNQPCP